eukprot:scaffold6351_cov166-Amphora_coffeaeformis.AAC.8
MNKCAMNKCLLVRSPFVGRPVFTEVSRIKEDFYTVDSGRHANYKCPVGMAKQASLAGSKPPSSSRGTIVSALDLGGHDNASTLDST